jgi:predicted DNA-binding transcriptional regulator AlpA
MSDTSTGTLTPLLLSAAGVAKLLGVSTRTIWNMHQDGQLGPLPVSLRGSTRWKTEEILAWVRADCPNRERWLVISENR